MTNPADHSQRKVRWPDRAGAVLTLIYRRAERPAMNADAHQLRGGGRVRGYAGTGHRDTGAPGILRRRRWQ